MIYLDHAATSYPKPKDVLAAMQRWFTDVGVSPARGSGERCQLAAGVVAATRSALAQLLGTDARHVAFVSGATEGLNLALRAVLRPGDTVLTTDLEHASVVRPLVALAHERALRIERLGLDARLGVDLEEAAAALARRPAVFVFTHASNVTGAVVDAANLVKLARAAGVTTLLDASQTAGYLDLRVGADVVVASGHKALHGPPGIGFVATTGLELPSQKQGGTGSSKALATHPEEWPGAFEAGTPNTPGIYGLGAALGGVSVEEGQRRLTRALAAVDHLNQALTATPGWRTLVPTTGQRVPVLSCVHARYDPVELAAILAGADVHVRAGHHCAPWIHGALGTAAAGTLRLSPGPDVTATELDFVVRLLTAL